MASGKKVINDSRQFCNGLTALFGGREAVAHDGKCVRSCRSVNDTGVVLSSGQFAGFVLAKGARRKVERDFAAVGLAAENFEHGLIGLRIDAFAPIKLLQQPADVGHTG